jgi:hypothetical protein
MIMRLNKKQLKEMGKKICLESNKYKTPEERNIFLEGAMFASELFGEQEIKE